MGGELSDGRRKRFQSDCRVGESWTVSQLEPTQQINQSKENQLFFNPPFELASDRTRSPQKDFFHHFAVCETTGIVVC